MNSCTPISLRKVQLLQLQVASEVRRICDNNGIKYFLLAGTLLGAIRHGGFIPWDDDIDIGMIREDYNKFVNIAKTELSEKYFLQNWETDILFALPILKIRVNGTKFIELSSANINIHNGISIDIFPFDNIPDNLILQKWQNVKTYILKRLLYAKSNYIFWTEKYTIKKTIFYFLKFISYFVTYKILQKNLFRQMTLFNYDTTQKVVTFGGSYGYRKETLERQWVDNLSVVCFEGEEFLAIKEYDKYLRWLYDDYMTPPPEYKRKSNHKIIEIDFGGY